MFKAFTEFQKLKKVMVGRGFSPSIMDNGYLEDKLTPSTKSLLTNLLEETEEDYQNLINICEEFGAEVVRPEYSSNNMDIVPYLMSPRDNLIALHDSLLVCNEAMQTSIDLCSPFVSQTANIKRGKHTFGLMPPSIVRLGKDIILDKQPEQISNADLSAKWVKDWLEPLGYKIIYTKTHDFKFKGNISHGDGCFSIQKPGVILTCREARHYTENIFKNWDVFQVPSAWEKMSKWNKFKEDTRSYAFTDAKYIDPVWNKLITDWLSDWVGYSQETIFDVNVLSLDENHVVVSHYNKEVFAYFKKHKIEPIISPWRHRFFWDGGIHCITMDLEREGECEQYL